jgi:hypothetical protein
MGGNIPLFAKGGRYVGPTGKIGFWFNLPFDGWEYAYSSQGPPSSSKGVPVIHIGEVNVAANALTASLSGSLRCHPGHTRSFRSNMVEAARQHFVRSSSA